MTTATTRKDAVTARPVLVTTAHRGIFFGYLAGDGVGPTIALSRARLAVYWAASMRGFMGLAVSGPDSGCRIGPAADITLRDITAVVEVTPEAATRWEAANWKDQGVE